MLSWHILLLHSGIFFGFLNCHHIFESLYQNVLVGLSTAAHAKCHSPTCFFPQTPTQQVMEHVQVILDQQNLSGYHGADIQTLIIPTSSSTTAMTTPTATSSQQTAQAILSNILNAEGSAEVYHVTLVDADQDVTVSTDNSTLQTVSAADFSAINLLASATTQLSLPQ